MVDDSTPLETSGKKDNEFQSPAKEKAKEIPSQSLKRERREESSVESRAEREGKRPDDVPDNVSAPKPSSPGASLGQAREGEPQEPLPESHEEEASGAGASNVPSPDARSMVLTSTSGEEEKSKTPIPKTHQDLREEIIERTLGFIEEQIRVARGSKKEKDSKEDIWFTWGAWQLWKEQLERLERVLTAEERKVYGERLSKAKKEILAAQQPLEALVSKKVEKAIQEQLERIPRSVEEKIRITEEKIKGMIERLDAEIKEVDAIEQRAGEKVENKIDNWWNKVEPQLDRYLQEVAATQEQLGKEIEGLKAQRLDRLATPIAKKVTTQIKRLEKRLEKQLEKRTSTNKRFSWAIITIGILTIGILLAMGAGLWYGLRNPQGKGAPTLPSPTTPVLLPSTVPTPTPTAVPPTPTPTPTLTPTPLPPVDIARVAAALTSESNLPPTEMPPKDFTAYGSISHGTFIFTTDTLATVAPPTGERNVLGPYHIVQPSEKDKNGPNTWPMTPGEKDTVQAMTSRNYLTPPKVDSGEYYLCSALAEGKAPQEGWAVTIRWKDQNKNTIRSFLKLPGKDEITCTKVEGPWTVWNVNFIGNTQSKEATLDLTAYQWWLIPLAHPASTPAVGGG